jgi:hypothetical protein
VLVKWQVHIFIRWILLYDSTEYKHLGKSQVQNYDCDIYTNTSDKNSILNQWTETKMYYSDTGQDKSLLLVLPSFFFPVPHTFPVSSCCLLFLTPLCWLLFFFPSQNVELNHCSFHCPQLPIDPQLGLWLILSI